MEGSDENTYQDIKEENVTLAFVISLILGIFIDFGVIDCNIRMDYDEPSVLILFKDGLRPILPESNILLKDMLIKSDSILYNNNLKHLYRRGMIIIQALSILSYKNIAGELGRIFKGNIAFLLQQANFIWIRHLKDILKGPINKQTLGMILSIWKHNGKLQINGNLSFPTIRNGSPMFINNKFCGFYDNHSSANPLRLSDNIHLSDKPDEKGIFNILGNKNTVSDRDEGYTKILKNRNKSIKFGPIEKCDISELMKGNLSIVGQFNDCFIILETKFEGNTYLLAVDQHAMDERSNMTDIIAGKPITGFCGELDSEDEVSSDDDLDIYIPKSLTLYSKKELYMIRSKSCRYAVKFNTHLSYKEMDKLVHRMEFKMMNNYEKLSNPYICAHGRPTIMSLAKFINGVP